MKKQNIIPKDKNGRSHGYWEVYHHSGEVYYRGYYIRGKEYGFWELFYPSGDLVYKLFHFKDTTYRNIHQTTNNKLLL